MLMKGKILDGSRGVRARYTVCQLHMELARLLLVPLHQPHSLRVLITSLFFNLIMI